MDSNGALVPTEIPSILKTLSSSAVTSSTPTGAAVDRQVLGADISWPQCPPGMGIPQKKSSGQPMPTDAAEYVIIGLTNGPSFAANPCLADQLAWAKARRMLVGAYAVSSYPNSSTLASQGKKGPFDGSTRLGALSNVGYQAALFNVASMKRAGLSAPTVWIDVERVPYFEWSGDVVANAAVIEGVARGYVDSGKKVGVYSTPYIWRSIVGGLSLGATTPEWRAAGKTSMDEALSRCGSDWSIQGGDAIFGQWVEASRDRNVTCPGAGRDLHLWFHQY
jgi:hypothetical protein